MAHLRCSERPPPGPMGTVAPAALKSGRANEIPARDASLEDALDGAAPGSACNSVQEPGAEAVQACRYDPPGPIPEWPDASAASA